MNPLVSDAKRHTLWTRWRSMTIGPGSEETLQKVMARYEREGFVGQFGARPMGQLRCFNCNEDLDPAKGQHQPSQPRT